jgi:hypothetical protein
MARKERVTKQQQFAGSATHTETTRRAYSVDDLTEVLPFSKGFIWSEIRSCGRRGSADAGSFCKKIWMSTCGRSEQKALPDRHAPLEKIKTPADP